MPTVRTTIQPDRELEVDIVEHAQLKALGLLIEDEPDSKTPTADPATPDKKTSSTAK